MSDWRRERDSNPRYRFRYSGFQDVPFSPPSLVFKHLHLDPRLASRASCVSFGKYCAPFCAPLCFVARCAPEICSSKSSVAKFRLSARGWHFPIDAGNENLGSGPSQLWGCWCNRDFSPTTLLKCPHLPVFIDLRAGPACHSSIP